MNDTLWGVAIGGAVAVVSALITSLVGPAMTARHQRASARAERLLAADAELDEAWSRWISAEDGFKPFSETETGVLMALRRLANASNSALLHRAIDRAFDDVTEVALQLNFGDPDDLSARTRRAQSTAADSVDEATRIAADMVDPPLLPIRVARWVRRRRSLRRWWLIQRRIALAGGA